MKRSIRRHQQESARLRHLNIVIARWGLIPDKPWKWFQIRGQAKFDSNGQPSKVFGVLVEIDARKKVEASLQASLAENVRLVEELRNALAKITQLEGLLPICISCKSIRHGDDWVRLESYISERSTAWFTHGVCPECLVNQLR